jgi:hypothetical protein
VPHTKTQRVGEIASAYQLTAGDNVRISDYVKGVDDALVS